MDQVSLEGEGRRGSVSVGFTGQSATGSCGERQPVQHCTAQPLYFLLLSANPEVRDASSPPARGGHEPVRNPNLRI